MRRLGVAVVVALFAITGVALAAAYRTGPYESGPQTGFTEPGIHIDIAKGSFRVQRILMHETCVAAGHTTFRDLGGFDEGIAATLSGTISKSGNFSGVYHGGHGGYTKISGHIKGHKLTVSGKEFSYYTPSGSTVKYACTAEGTFHPKRV
jgi:hypothetical protein